MERRTFLQFAAGAVAARPWSKLVAFTRPVLPPPQSPGPGKPVGGLPANWGCIHYQWEFPAWVPEAGKHFDMKAYISGLLEAGADAIHLLTRAEPGVYNYPTKIGFERDPSGRDWPREVLDEINRQGGQDKLKVIAYFTLTVDNSAAKHRPEWFQINREGKPGWSQDVFGENRWALVCINSPWREYSLNLMEEIATLYPEIAGFWLDEPHFDVFACYCRWCEEGFRKSYGYPLPRDPKTGKKPWLEMKQFQVDSILRYFEDFKKRVISRYPYMIWTWNGSTAPCDWDRRVWQAAPINSREVQEGYLEALVWAKRLRSYQRPFEVTLGRDYTWMDMRTRPEWELKTVQAISVAHGGGELIGDGPYPDGRIREDGLTWGKGIFGWKRGIQPWLEEAEPFSEVALFDSWDANRVRFVRDLGSGANLWDFAALPLVYHAWAKLLAAANIQFDIVNEDHFDLLSKYRAVILPDLPYLADSAIESLEKYVQGGGTVLATFRTGLYGREGELSPSPGLWKLLGLEFREFSSYRGNYIRLEDRALKKGLHPMPLLVLGTATVCDLTTAKALAYVTLPIGELGPETRVWFDYNPPRATSTQHPSVALNQWGRGRVVYIAHPMEERWLRGSYWALGQLLLNVLDLLVPERLIKIRAPTEVRAITAIQKGQRRMIIHLLNEADWTAGSSSTTTQRWSSQESMDMWVTNQSPYPWKHPVVPNVGIELRHPFPSVSRVYLAPSRRALRFRVTRDQVTLTVPEVDTHTVVVLEP